MQKQGCGRGGGGEGGGGGRLAGKKSVLWVNLNERIVTDAKSENFSAPDRCHINQILLRSALTCDFFIIYPTTWQW